MKKYNKYKRTKNIWFPELPIHWILTKVKYISHTIAGGTPSTDRPDFWDNGNIPWLPSGKLQNCDITTAEKFITEEGLNNSSTKWIKPDTTLIALTGATCANIGYLRFKACANQSVIAIDEFLDKANSRFLFYMFLDMRKQILTHQSGGAQAGINDGNVKNLYLVLPSLNEQTKIAQYLDHQTAIIDQLIQQKERLIELLKEKRQAVINEAVTKGLNPNAKMKDSGIEWLGEVPEDWGLVPLKHLGTIKYGLGQPPKYKEGGLPLIRATNVERGKIVSKDLVFVDPDDVPFERDPVLRENDIVVVRSGAYTADSAIIPKEFEGAITGYDMVIRANKVNPKLLAFALLSQYLLNNQLFLKRMRSAQPHLNAEELGESFFLLPSQKEQVEIVVFLEREIDKIDNLSDKIKTAINKLKEYRQSIISEAVTGKIDVRDWKLSEPQMVTD